MFSMSTASSPQDEIRRRFYPDPDHRPQKKENSDDLYLSHRYPLLLQRLYQIIDASLDTYASNDFIYDRYPDYVSLHHMRDRLLRENLPLAELFLQEGCPITWLNLLTDSIISERLTKRHPGYRKPMGDASTTSVRSAARS